MFIGKSSRLEKAILEGFRRLTNSLSAGEDALCNSVELQKCSLIYSL